MKFEFKGLSSYEENSMPNFMGDAEIRSVIQEFINMDEAIEYVSNHHGFVKTEDGKFAFEVRNISAVG
ncbi:hypothetical protein [Lactococcus taiwanensis]|jgi:hypothetical protein|uniref:Uncharacterized protein n=1 Tax=Lactococcus taiwanensis TaxID=1151742 RepID=A0AA45KGD9_9LACT|nr:hypothetical protein [Lactococcus taiwanensis]KZK36830.1 hypothetical protein P7266_1728 [Lactococcus cremoris]QRZ10753.1 hypothetical protein JVB21_08310 [Lactococcus taiwanensis]QSE76870.1 hypothetical protein JW886_00850 [Lactococcus taiwanensis]